MADEVVYYEIDTERTSGEAYSEFTLQVLKEFSDKGASLTHNQRQELSKADPQTTAAVASVGYFVLREIAAPYLVDWLKDQSKSSKDGSLVINTDGGDVYINPTIITEKEAEERLQDDRKD